MKTDPGEMANLAVKLEHQDTLARHRDYLRNFAEKYKDTTALAMLKAAEST